MHETEKTLLEEQLAAVTTELKTLAVLHKETGDWEIRFDTDSHSEAKPVIAISTEHLKKLRVARTACVKSAENQLKLTDLVPTLPPALVRHISMTR
jgi:hypothetical protein